MCLNLKTKPIWHYSDRRGLTVGDALCASVSGTGYDWRSDLDVFGIETGVILNLACHFDVDTSRDVWSYTCDTNKGGY